MKIEMNDEARFAITVFGGLALFFGMVVACVYLDYSLDHAALKAGLHQEQCIGSERIIWTK